MRIDLPAASSANALAASQQAVAARPALLRTLWRRLLELKFRCWQRRRYRRLALVQVRKLEILVLDEVFNPAMFRTGPFLVDTVHREASHLAAGASVLELGSGSGIGALTIANSCDGALITAVDINPQAVRCSRINALLHGHAQQIEVLRGDLFAPVAGRRFDLVLFHPPFWRGEPDSDHDRALYSTDIAERFAAGLPAHLSAGGRSLLLLSSDGDQAAFLKALARAGFTLQLCASRDLINEVLTAYLIQRP